MVEAQAKNKTASDFSTQQKMWKPWVFGIWL